MNDKNAIMDLILSPKTGTAVSTATTGSGLGTLLDLIPNDIGKLATLVGILLSIVLIYAHILAVRKTRIEIEILRAQEADRQAAIQWRVEHREPVRRVDDQVPPCDAPE